jgi:hypothetical protein
MDKKHKYGFMTENEAGLLDGLLADIKAKFGEIRFLEIGVFGGGTTHGIYQRAAEIGCSVHCEGVDFEMWKPSGLPADYTFHAGDSMDTWRNVTGSFNLLFVDGCHCVNHAMADFLNYSPFVEVGGFALFHDTAPGANGQQGTWPQDHSYAGQPPSVLGVRSGLEKIGLLQGYRKDWQLVREIAESELMGMSLFEKILPLT